MNSERVIIYCRESRDDRGEHYDRIETQRDLLIKFCQNNNLSNIIKIIMDDDVSGTDFGRFREIRQLALANAFDVLVFKDSSRLGRNQLESLKFTAFLEECNVRIVFENEKFDEDLFPLLAWFNEQRAKDDSRKIRRNLRHKIEVGELTIRPHFGYNKSGRCLVPNSDICIVQKAFEMCLEGRSVSEIAQTLSFSPQKVRRMLKNRVYCGDYVGGTTQKVSFKSKKIRRLPPDEWVIIENHHPPAVDRDTFQKVQKKLAALSRQRGTNLFSGRLFCGSCGSVMYYISKKGRPLSYICGNYHRFGLNSCTAHRIRLNVLTALAEKHLRDAGIKPESEIPGFFRRIEIVDSNNVRFHFFDLYQNEMSTGRM